MQEAGAEMFAPYLVADHALLLFDSRRDNTAHCKDILPETHLRQLNHE